MVKTKQSYLFSVIAALTLIVLPLTLWVTYGRAVGWPLIEPDSTGYYERSVEFLHLPPPRAFFSEHRTPGYPLFLLFSAILSGTAGSPVDSPEFFLGMQAAVTVQIVIHLLSLLLLYHILTKVGVSKIMSLLYSLFMAADILLFTWDFAILTESVTVAWLIGMMYLSLLLLEKPTSTRFIWFFLASVIGFIIRPVYAAFPISVLPFVALHHKTVRITTVMVISLILWAVIPIAYSSMNQRLWGYRGINHISDINILGRILRHNLPIESAKNIPYFYEKVSSYRAIGEDVSMPYKFLNYYDPAIYGNTEKLNNLMSFTQTIMIRTPIPFFASIISDVPEAFIHTDFTDITRVKNIAPSPAKQFFEALFSFYANIKWVTFLLLLLFPFILFRFLRAKHNLWLAVLTCLGSISLYQIFVSLLLGYAEFDRLAIPIQPQLYFFSLAAMAEFLRPLSHAVKHRFPFLVHGLQKTVRKH